MDYCGIVSGNKEDKSELFEVFYEEEFDKVPLIKESAINHVCKLVKTIDFGDNHYIFIGEIVETLVDENLLIKKKLNLNVFNPISYTTVDNQYRKLGVILGKAYKIGRTIKKN